MIHDHEIAVSAARQLGAMIDRAQDERLRLMRMVKEYQQKHDALPEPVSAEHIKRIMDAVRKLDAAITDRLATLTELDQRVDRRIDQMARLEASLIELTDRLGRQVEEARGFSALVDAAKRQVRAAAAAAQMQLASQSSQPQDAPQPHILAADIPPARSQRNIAAVMHRRIG